MQQGTENNYKAILLGDIDRGGGLEMIVDDIVKYCVIYKSRQSPAIISRAYWLKHVKCKRWKGK